MDSPSILCSITTTDNQYNNNTDYSVYAHSSKYWGNRIIAVTKNYGTVNVAGALCSAYFAREVHSSAERFRLAITNTFQPRKEA